MEAILNVEYLKSADLKPVVAKPTVYPTSFKLIRLAYRFLGDLFPATGARIAYKLFSTPRKRASHKVSDEMLEKARIFELMYAQRILKAYEWGSGAETILLVHGWESRGTALRSFVPELVKRGYRVVAFDGPAHGHSEGQRTNLLHFGGAVRAIINHLGGVKGIITHSFGGASTVFALRNLDNSINIDKLVLISVPSDLEKILNHFLKSIHAPAAVRKHFYKIIESKIKRPIAATNVSEAFSNIKIGETLLIHDEEDQVVPLASSKSIASRWERSTLLISKGLGHFRLIKNLDVIQRVSVFIDQK